MNIVYDAPRHESRFQMDPWLYELLLQENMRFAKDLVEIQKDYHRPVTGPIDCVIVLHKIRPLGRFPQNKEYKIVFTFGSLKEIEKNRDAVIKRIETEKDNEGNTEWKKEIEKGERHKIFRDRESIEEIEGLENTNMILYSKRI